MSAFFEFSRELDKRIVLDLKYNDNCPPHFHSNIELVYVIDGEIDININGHNKTLKKGCVSIANSYDIHAYTYTSGSKTFVMIIPVELVGAYAAMLRSKAFSTPFTEASRETRLIYLTLLKLYKSDGHGYELISKGCAYYILGLLLNRIDLIEKTSPGSLDLARKILVYMQENYLNSFTIDNLARHLGYNKDYLSRFFHNYLRCGFNSYLNGLRSRHAINLMENGMTNLTEVAYASGFSSYRTFNRAFKQSFYLSPSEYKKKLAEK